MRKILLLLLVITCGQLFAQRTHFRKTTSALEATNAKCAIANDSGWFVFGYFNLDVRIQRYTRSGQLLWTKGLQQTGTTENIVNIMNRGTHLLCFYSTTASGGGITVARLDTNANITWKQTVSFSGIRSTLVASNGDIYLVGNTGVLRMDSLGTVKWRKNYSTSAGEWWDMIEITPQRFLMLGRQEYFTINNAAVTINCIDSSGIVGWTRVLGYPQGFDFGYYPEDFILSSDGYLYITGDVNRQIPSLSTFDAFVMKVDTSNYNAVWTRNFGTNSVESSAEIKEAADGTFLIWGQSQNWGSDAYLTRVTANAQIISNKRTGNISLSEQYMDIIPMYDGTSVVVGYQLNTVHISRLSYSGSEGCADTLFFIWPYDQLVATTSLLVPNSTVTNVAATTFNTTVTTVVTASSAPNVCYNTCLASAAFQPSQLPYCIGDTVGLINKSTGALSYYWYVNGLLIDSTLNFSFLPMSTGNYVVKLKARGVACSDSMQITIPIDGLPDAVFTSAGTGLVRTFSPANFDSGTNYFWSFGDGKFAADAPFQHCYLSAGIYDVQLIASNACGGDTTRLPIIVTDTVQQIFDWRFDEGGVGYPHYGSVARQWPDGRIFIAGTFDSPYQDAYFGLASSTGQLYKSKTISLGANNDRYDEILLRSSYRVLMIGRTGTTMVIQQMDTSGSINFVHRYTFAGAITTSRAAETRDYGFAVCGSLPSGGFLAKFSAYNVLSKVTQYPGTSNIKSISPQRSGQLLIGGNSSSNLDIVLIHCDSSGAELSALQLDAGYTEILNDMITSNNGDLIFTGTYNPGAGALPFVLRTDSSGNIIWSRAFNFNISNAIPSDIVETIDGRIFIWCNNGINGYLIAIDSLGLNPVVRAFPDVQNARMTYSIDDGLLICGYSPASFTVFLNNEELRLLKFHPQLLTSCAGSQVLVTSSNLFWTNSAPSVFVSTQVMTKAVLPTTTIVRGIRDTLMCSYSSMSVMAIIDPPGQICSGVPTQFTEQSAGNITSYNWSFPGGSPASSSSTSPSVSWAAAGTYTITLVVSNLMNTSTATMVVTVGQQPSVSCGPDLSICMGSSIQITSSGSGGTSFVWSPSAGLSSTSIANPIATPTVTTTYQVNYSNSSGCYAVDSILVTVNPLPTVNAGSGLSMCSGDSVTLNGIGNGSPVWIPGGSLSSSSIFTPLAYPTATTTYTLVITDSNGCTISDQVTVTVFPLPSANAGPDLSVCFGDSVMLGGSGNGTPIWIPSGSLSSSSIFNPNAFPTSTTTYTLQSTSPNGCVASDQVIVVVNPLPTANAGPDISICYGDSVILAGSGSGSPMWSPSIGLSSNLIFTPVAFPSSSTTYVLQTSDGNGCTISDQMNLVVNPLPPAPTITISGNYLISSTGSSYQWYLNGLLLNGEVNDTLIPLSIGQYSVSIIDSNGCTSAQSVPVVITTVPVSSISEDISLYPNPTNESLFIFMPFNNAYEYDLVITDVSGRVVLTQSGNLDSGGMIQLELNLSFLSTGSYFLILQTDTCRFTGRVEVVR